MHKYIKKIDDQTICQIPNNMPGDRAAYMNELFKNLHQ